MTSGLFLCVDLSSTTASLALHEADGRLRAETELPPGPSHSEQCLVALDRMLKASGTRLPSMARFVTPSGPGSFTGLRIALASLKAFAMALDRPIETMSGAEARARAWAEVHRPPRARLLAVSQVSRDEYARCEMSSDEAGALRYLRETTVAAAGLFTDLAPTEHPPAASLVLLDDRTELPAPGPGPGWLVERFPLRARHLVPALAQAATRRTYATLDEWVDAAPAYFGGGRFR